MTTSHSSLWKKTLTAALVTASLALGGTALAQQRGAAQPNPMDLLKAELQITPAQEAAWNAYTTAYSTAFVPSRDLSPKEFNALTTPERLNFLKTMRQEDNAFINKRFDATVAMYNQLSDQQKKRFDEITAVAEQAPAPQGKAKSKKKSK